MTPKEYISANQTVSIKKTADGKETIVKQTNPKALENLRKVEKGYENALAKTRENLKNNLPKSTNGYNTSYYDYPSLNYALTTAEKGTGLSHTHNLKLVKVPLGNGNITPRFFAFTIVQYHWLTLILNGVPLQKGVKRTKTTTPSQAFDGTITSAERYSLMATFGIGPSQNFDNNNGNDNSNVNNANANGNGNIQQGGNFQQGGNIQGGNFNQAGANLSQNNNSGQGQPINTRSNSATATPNGSTNVNKQSTPSSASSSSSSTISLSSSSVKSASKTSSTKSSVANNKSIKSSESASSSQSTVTSSSASSTNSNASKSTKGKTTKKLKITPTQRARAVKLRKTMKYVKKRNPILKTSELLNMIYAVTHIKTPKGLDTMTSSQCQKAIHIVKTFLPSKDKPSEK